MSRLTTQEQGREYGEDDRRERYYYPPQRSESSGRSSGLLTTLLIAAGLGGLAWYYLGPDLRRYMKLRNM
jgi:hypothetical protein